MYSSTIQQRRAKRLRRKMRRKPLIPIEAYEFKNPDEPYQYKKYWQRRHRVQRNYSCGKRWRNNSHNWS